MRLTVYTVVIYDLIRNKIDYQFPDIFDNFNDAEDFADMGGDSEFITLVACHDLQKNTVSYI